MTKSKYLQEYARKIAKENGLITIQDYMAKEKISSRMTVYRRADKGLIKLTKLEGFTFINPKNKKEK